MGSCERGDLIKLFQQTYDRPLLLPLSLACPCQSVLISSTGGLQEHHPQAVGIYSLAGHLWEGRVPYYQAQNGLFLSPDRFSSPDGEFPHISWLVTETLMGSNGIAKSQEQRGEESEFCPELATAGGWTVLWQHFWQPDPTL